MRRVVKNLHLALEDDRPAELLLDGDRIEAVLEPGQAPVDLPVEDLEGKRIAPGFVDAHCHILPMGLDLQKPHLGDCRSRDEVLARVAEAHRDLEPGRWLHAVHYDQNRFADGQHLHRDALDAITRERPILLRHSSGHASVGNTAALRAAGVDEKTPDPSGGTYVRDESGRLTGVLLEDAHTHVTGAAPEPTLEEMVDAILAACRSMRTLGIVAAADMMTGRWDLERELQAYHQASLHPEAIVTRLYLQWGRVFGGRGLAGERLAELIAAMDGERCDVRGIKIFADGAIGAGTAAIYGRYEDEPDLPPGNSGTLMYSPERLREMVTIAHNAGYSLAIHTIGDRSTDLVLDAYEATGEPARHRVEHAMLLSPAQVERVARLGCPIVAQPEFLVRFGDTYRRKLGLRAARLKPHASILAAGIPLAFSSDRPIVPGDPRDGIAAAVTRPSGFAGEENISPVAALRAYTVTAAEVCGDTDRLGRLAPGSPAVWNVMP